MVIKEISDGHEAFEKVGECIEKIFKFETGFYIGCYSWFGVLF